jgi:hypothetical protein
MNTATVILKIERLKRLENSLNNHYSVMSLNYLKPPLNYGEVKPLLDWIQRPVLYGTGFLGRITQNDVQRYEKDLQRYYQFWEDKKEREQKEEKNSREEKERISKQNEEYKKKHIDPLEKEISELKKELGLDITI